MSAMRGLAMAACVAALGAGPLGAQTTEPIAKGRQIYANWCVHCHREGGSASRVLEERYRGKVPAVIEERTDLAATRIVRLLRTQTPGMTAFRPTDLTDSDLEAVAAYLTRNNALKR